MATDRTIPYARKHLSTLSRPIEIKTTLRNHVLRTNIHAFMFVNHFTRTICEWLATLRCIEASIQCTGWSKTRTQEEYIKTSMLPLLWKRLMGGKNEAAPHRVVQGWVSQNGYGSEGSRKPENISQRYCGRLTN